MHSAYISIPLNRGLTKNKKEVSRKWLKKLKKKNYNVHLQLVKGSPSRLTSENFLPYLHHLPLKTEFHCLDVDKEAKCEKVALVKSVVFFISSMNTSSH